jgi:hypothetical protein
MKEVKLRGGRGEVERLAENGNAWKTHAYHASTVLRFQASTVLRFQGETYGERV